MDLETCLKKMELVGVLAFATVDSDGAPQIRNISAVHYEPGLSHDSSLRKFPGAFSHRLRGLLPK